MKQNDNQSVSDRLKHLAKHYDMSVAKLERACNLSNGYVNNLKGTPSVQKLGCILSAFPKVSKSWLLHGSGSMLADDNVQNYPSFGRQERSVPLLPVNAQAGSLTEFVAQLESSACEHIISPVVEVDYALRVNGDSMSPEYPSGSIVLVKKIDASVYVEWGSVYVIDTRNGILIKRVEQTADGIRCHSINESYADIEVAGTDVLALYKVVCCISFK